MDSATPSSPDESENLQAKPEGSGVRSIEVRGTDTGENVSEDITAGRAPDHSSRAVLALAIPALGALVVEPLLLLVDSVMIGYLGTAPLAGLALASTVLLTLVGVFVFLAYSTTALTARAVGAGKPGVGIQAGIHAIWLAAGLGLVLVTLLVASAPAIVSALGADVEVGMQATAYLRGGAPGMAGMLVILAATGTLRGLLDMRTPLYVLAGGATLNVALNFLLIFGLSLGILGAGIALSVTQLLMAIVLVATIVKKAGPYEVSFRPSMGGVIRAAGDGMPLFIRTISLRAALLATVAIATMAGTLTLAAHQVVNTIWTLAAFSLDALAIAAQSLVGVALGAGNRHILRSLIRKMTWWGVGSATVLGAIIAAGSPWIPLAFGSDPELHMIATRALLVTGALLPVAGIVFLLDGVLIGASEGNYLAVMGLVTLVLYLPLLALLRSHILENTPLSAAQQGIVLVWLWLAFAGWFMIARAVANGIRAFSPKLGQSAVSM